MRLTVAFAIAPILLAFSAGAADLTLARDGVSEYVLVVAEDAIAAEQTAARELQSHLEAVSGVELPICTGVSSAPKRIVVGAVPEFRTAFPDIDLAGLGHDGIVMKTRGDILYLAGGRPRGTLYAVYTFLEDVVGVRWWSSTESFIPERPTLTIPALDTVYTPKLLYREAFYRDAFEGVFAARCKCNGHHDQVPPEYGAHYSILGWCHTFYQILPPGKYFDEHPDWYSEIDGKRTPEGAQLCLTNEAMRAEFVKNALEWLRKDPEAGIISISQNDCHGWCRCSKCMALEEKEGSHAGPIIHFVNAVAEAIEQEFPDVLVETLAYSYSRQAPRHVTPRRNVIIRLCSIECSYVQPLATGPQNEAFRTDIEQWSAIAPRLYIWNYVTNFRHSILPHPNMRVLAPNIRYFVDHNAIGLFEQGDAYSACGDFVELRAWLLAHLMWDPSRDEKALIREFLEGYYGPAAQPLGEYLDLIHDTAESSGVYLRCYMDDTSAWLDLEAMNKATALFDQAQAAVAADPTLSTLVRRARMPLDHAWLQRYHTLRRAAKAADKPFAGPDDPAAFLDDFIKTAYAFNVGGYREGGAFKDYEPQLRARFRPPGPPPKECAGLPENRWIDIQDHEFSLHGYGNWATFVDDAEASDGRAARMPANHTQWAIQYPVSADVAVLNPVRCYVVARCEAEAQDGNAFQLGIYDTRERKDVARKTATLAEAGDSQYHTFDLGVHTLRPDMYFWIASMNNPGAVTAVFVDHIFFIRDKP